MTDELDAAQKRYEAARDRVAILTGLANRKTADPGRVLADLEAAALEERAALRELVMTREARTHAGDEKNPPRLNA